MMLLHWMGGVLVEFFLVVVFAVGSPWLCCLLLEPLPLGSRLCRLPLHLPLVPRILVALA